MGRLVVGSKKMAGQPQEKVQKGRGVQPGRSDSEMKAHEGSKTGSVGGRNEKKKKKGWGETLRNLGKT